MSALGLSSNLAFIPVAAELGIASAIYLVVILKRTPKGNFHLAIVYSSFKLLAICSVVATNLSIFSIGRLPFLFGLLLSEVVLLIASFRNQAQLRTIVIRSMFEGRMLVARVIGELLTVIVLWGVSVGTLVTECDCRKERDEFLFEVFQRTSYTCDPADGFRITSEVISPQLRGLAFAIAVTASAVSVSGWQFILSGFAGNIIGKQSDPLLLTLRDSPWKKSVRKVYSILSIVTVVLFLVSFFLPGLAQCIQQGTAEEGEDVVLRYTLGVVSNAFLNTLLAISQMFVADIHVRLAAVKAVEDAESDSEDNPLDGDEEGELSSEENDDAAPTIAGGVARASSSLGGMGGEMVDLNADSDVGKTASQAGSMRRRQTSSRTAGSNSLRRRATNWDDRANAMLQRRATQRVTFSPV